MAGELTAGGGAMGDGPVSVGLTLDTSGWEKNLDRARASLDRHAKNMEGRFEQMASKLKAAGDKQNETLKNLGGAFAGGLSGGLLGGGLAGVLQKAGEAGSKAMLELGRGIDRVRHQTLQLDRQTAELNDRLARSQKLAAERLAAAVSPDDRNRELERQIASMTAEVGDLDAKAGRAANKLDEINSTFDGDGWQLFLGGKLEAANRDLESKMQTWAAGADQLRSKLKDANEERAKLLNAGTNPAFLGALNKFADDLDTKLKTMSMSPLEAQLEGIRKQFNATDAQMDKVLDKAREFEKVQKDFETRIKFDETLKQLNFEAAIIGMGDRDKKRAEFQRQGFNEDQLDQLMGQWDANEARQKAYAPKLPVPRAEVALAGSREAAATIVANAGRGGVNPAAMAQQAQAKQVEQGNAMVGWLKTLADQGAKAIEQQKVYEKLLREQTLKAGGDDMLFPIDG